jgi:NitT/TauT family transport system substrate-binding protein
MKTIAGALIAASLAAAVSIPAVAAAPGPLRIHGAASVLEAAPMLLAAEGAPAGTVLVRNGGVPNLWRAEDDRPAASTASASSDAIVDYPGHADLAGNAETQALRLSVAHPDIRILMTVTEGLYRIVARRSSGIATLADLRGKRIATFTNTSAAYYLHRVLAKAGMTEADVTIVPLSAAAIGDAIIAGRADAIAIWEPEAERAGIALGKDAISFEDVAVYREIYNLNSTTEALSDPAKRAQIVAFIRRLIPACQAATRDPARAQQLAAARTGYPVPLVAASWKHHRFPCALPADLLGVMAQEEVWLARIDGRAARSREQLAPLIDPAPLREALAR